MLIQTKAVGIVLALVVCGTRAVADPPLTEKERMTAAKAVAAETIKSLNEHLDASDRLPTKFTVTDNGPKTRAGGLDCVVKLKTPKGAQLNLHLDIIGGEMMIDTANVRIPWHKDQNHPSRQAVQDRSDRYLRAWLAAQKFSEQEQGHILAKWEESRTTLRKVESVAEITIVNNRFVFYANDSISSWTVWTHADRHPEYPD